MTEQQNHLKNLLEQRDSILKDISAIQDQISTKREVLFKVQGVIEYLTQIGTSLPSPSDAVTPEVVAPDGEVSQED